jgi:hypothetical protein
VFDVVDDQPVPQLVPREDIPDGGRDELACPVCGSEEDVYGEGKRGGVVLLRCHACGHRWSRVPRWPCPRCGSGDVDVTSHQPWDRKYLDEARAGEWRDPGWHYDEDSDVYRCRNCYNEWPGRHGT